LCPSPPWARSELTLFLVVFTLKKKNIRQSQVERNQHMSTPTRFELARAEPIGFQNQLLNHSDTVSPAGNRWGVVSQSQTKIHRHRRDLNSRGQSPVDFESTSLTTRTRCLECTSFRQNKISELARVTRVVWKRFWANTTKQKRLLPTIANPSFDLGTFRL
jgi:C4-dicarboxylate-specific signal transduction histidine kinase